MEQDELTNRQNKRTAAQARSRSDYGLREPADQIRWLAARARILGYTSIDELCWKDPVQFELLATHWRNLIRGVVCINYGEVSRTKKCR